MKEGYFIIVGPFEERDDAAFAAEDIEYITGEEQEVVRGTLYATALEMD